MASVDICCPSCGKFLKTASANGSGSTTCSNCKAKIGYDVRNGTPHVYIK